MSERPFRVTKHLVFPVYSSYGAGEAGEVVVGDLSLVVNQKVWVSQHRGIVTHPTGFSGQKYIARQDGPKRYTVSVGTDLRMVSSPRHSLHPRQTVLPVHPTHLPAGWPLSEGFCWMKKTLVAVVK